MKKKQILFILLTLLFFGIVIIFVYDMSRRTVSPWEKKKLKNHSSPQSFNFDFELFVSS